MKLTKKELLKKINTHEATSFICDHTKQAITLNEGYYKVFDADIVDDEDDKSVNEYCLKEFGKTYKEVCRENGFIDEEGDYDEDEKDYEAGDDVYWTALECDEEMYDNIVEQGFYYDENSEIIYL